MMQTGVTDMDMAVQVMLNNGVRMEKLYQGWNGHLVNSLIILRCIAVYVGRQVIISKIYRFGNFPLLLPLLLHICKPLL